MPDNVYRQISHYTKMFRQISQKIAKNNLILGKSAASGGNSNKGIDFRPTR